MRPHSVVLTTSTCVRFVSCCSLFLAVPALCFALAACAGDDGASDDSPDDGVDSGSPGDDGSGSDAGAEQVPLIEGLATLAGVGAAGNQDGSRDEALFNNPVNVLVAPNGDLIVADFDNGLIRQVTPDGDVTTLSRDPTPPSMFKRPFGLALSGDMLYVQTDGNSLGQATEVGPAALWSMPLDGGSPELVRDILGRSRGMVELPDGRLALAFYQQHVVQIYDPMTGTLTPLAGVERMAGFADGQGAEARFDGPYDIVLLEDGNLLVSDFANHRLRLVDLDGNVTTYAGTGLAGTDDGPIASATFNAPQGLAIDGEGHIYVTDTGSYRVRHISPEGAVTTIAGNGSPGYRDDEDPMAGELYGLEGADVGEDGYLYVADGSRGETVPYHRLRRLTLP